MPFRDKKKTKNSVEGQTPPFGTSPSPPPQPCTHVESLDALQVLLSHVIPQRPTQFTTAWPLAAAARRQVHGLNTVQSSARPPSSILSIIFHDKFTSVSQISVRLPNLGKKYLKPQPSYYNGKIFSTAVLTFNFDLDRDKQIDRVMFVDKHDS